MNPAPPERDWTVFHEAAFLVGALLAASVISYVLTKLLTGAWAF